MNITDYYGDLGVLLYTTPIVSAFAAAFALLVKRQRTRPQLWLFFIFIVLCVGMAASFVFDRYLCISHAEILRPVNFTFSTASSVTILFYYISLMRPHLLTRRFIATVCCGWLLFSLCVILLSILFPQMPPVHDIRQIFRLSSPTVIYRLVINSGIVIFNVWLTVYVIRMYRSYRRFIGNAYSFSEGITLSWISITIIMFILTGILDMIWMINSSSAFKMLFHIVSFIAIWTIFYFGFRQDGLPQPEPEEESKRKADDGLSTPADNKQAKLKADLLAYFKQKKPYLNPELSLKDLAQEMGTSHYTLSRFINKEFQINFYTLINRFRIEYILGLIETHGDKINSDSLYSVSGFKSRTVFFRQFKETTGCTPKEYIDRKKKNNVPISPVAKQSKKHLATDNTKDTTI